VEFCTSAANGGSHFALTRARSEHLVLFSDGPVAEVVDAEVYVGYDQRAEISCRMRANPAAEVTWMHNDTPTDAFDNINVFASQ